MESNAHVEAIQEFARSNCWPSPWRWPASRAFCSWTRRRRTSIRNRASGPARADAPLLGRVIIVAIAHRLSTVRAADRIVVLNHGRIAEAGRHGELMAIDNGLYQRLYLLQQLASDDEPR